MKTKNLTLTVIAALLGVVSCKNNAQQETAQVETTKGIRLDLMDTSVNPNDDFFKYVNGKWLETATIPDDQSSWGSFNELRKKTDDDVLAIIKAAASDNKDVPKIEVLPGSDQEKAIKLYQTILDTIARNQMGIEPLKPFLSKINAINNVSDLQKYLTEMESLGGGGFFSFSVRADLKNSDINSAYLNPGRLGLPDRDYYLKDDSDSKEKRKKYLAYITTMLQYLGENEAEANAQANQILAFETKMADPRMDKVERRDARKRYNPKSISDLQKMVPAIKWDSYFKGIGVKQIDTVIVSDVKYMNALQTILSDNDIANWKAYLRWTMFNRLAGTLSSDIEKTSWEFYGKTLSGAKKQRPIEERALQTVNGNIGEALGKLYVQQKFPPEAKERAKNMISNVIKAFENRIRNVSWMTDETKEKAIGKLLALKVKIAYPDQWRDYSALEIDGTENGGSYLQNILNVSAWNHNNNLKDLGNPVDKSRWGMAPQIVNAYFNPSYNEIVFPAAILQPPFYNYQVDDAVNYGGMGAVIGHEISHCFDDSGSRYDKNGNLNNWWSDEDLKQFEALGKSLAEQYSDIEVLPETHINGAFTLGENIGDLGGVNVAYDALQLSLEENGRPGKIDGYTPEQRFFISWATVWRTKYRDDALKSQIKTDPHSPGMNRAVQPLLNIDAFYDAFNIKASDSMYLDPEKRVKIW